MRLRGFLKACMYLIIMLSIVFLVYFLVGAKNSPDVFRQYESVKPGITSNYSKTQQFLTTYLISSGDDKLAIQLGLSKDEIEYLRDPFGSNNQDDHEDSPVPKDAEALRQLILSAQGSDPGSGSANNAVFKIMYPNTSETYTSLKSFNTVTKGKIESLNSGSMSLCQVQVWQWESPNRNSTDFSKKTVTISVNCCTALHPIIKAAFAEIYNDPSKPVITVVGGYNVRGMNNNSPNSSSSTSTHSYGGTLDINYQDSEGRVDWNHNNDNGSSSQPYPRTKSEWDKLAESQYKYECIYEGCAIVRCFEKYGLMWGGNWSIDYCDPMHFSIFNH